MKKDGAGATGVCELADMLEQLGEEATPAPWHHRIEAFHNYVIISGYDQPAHFTSLPSGALVVALRNHLPEIIAALRAQRSETAPAMEPQRDDRSQAQIDADLKRYHDRYGYGKETAAPMQQPVRPDPTDLEEVKRILQRACDRDWTDESLYQSAVIAANAIYWRDITIAKLKGATPSATVRGTWEPISKNPDIDGRLWPIVVVRDGKVTMDYEYYHFDNGWASDEEILNWWSLPITPVRGTVKIL